MELRDYLGILKRRWRQVAVVAALTVIVALAASALVPPRWESHVVLRVAPTAVPATTYESVLTADMLAKTYRELINSDYVATKAMELLFIEGSVDSFKRDISVELVPDTELVMIRASARSAGRARAKAAAVADAAIAYVKTAGLKDEVTIAIPALLPDRAVWPRPTIAAGAGLLFGLLLGVTLALAFDFLGGRIEKAADAEDKAGLKVIGQVPRVAGLGPRTNAFTEPSGLLAEHFRHLRTAVLYSMDSHRLDSILITSAEPGQGKTMVAANLAVSLAKTGKRVLLIDGDMRMPSVHTFFDVDIGTGLSEYLHGATPLEDVVVKSGFENLMLLTAGASSAEPSELLGSARLSDLLQETRYLADITVIDSPPAVTVTDAVILAARVDGVILIVDHHQRVDSVKRALASLDMVGARTLGAVLNRAETDRRARKSNYYVSPAAPTAGQPEAPASGST